MSEQYFNRLKINGTNSEVNKVMRFLKNKNLNHSPHNEEVNQFALSRVNPIPSKLEENEELSIQWCIQNWDCKGIAECWEDKKKELHFLTVNGHGLKLVKSLSKLFPSIEFMLIHDIETYSADYLEYYIVNGEVVQLFKHEEQIIENGNNDLRILNLKDNHGSKY